MKIGVISPKVSEESAKYLSDIINAKYLGQRYEKTLDFTDYDILFNYGVSGFNAVIKPNCQIINNPKSVQTCVNKLKTFYSLYKDADVIQFTEKPKKAIEWIKEGNTVVARKQTNGYQGKGLEYIYTEEEFNNTPAKFWTKYFDHQHEVRVNVYQGKILTVYEKINNEAKNETEFIHLDIDGEHPDVTKMISGISKNIGIEFYGMDILVDDEGNCKLLEINSAPILHKETATKLASIFKSLNER